VTEQRQPGPEASAPRACPWCGASAPEHARTCAACGAALAQREAIGELAIPGLTDVDPALREYDQRPLRLRGPSASQGIAPALIAGATAGGPIGLAVLGGVAAVAAAEYLGTRRVGTEAQALETLGTPSNLVAEAAARLQDGSLGPAGEGDVWRDLPAAMDTETAGLEETDGG
jgi:hypothetical protein